MASVTKALEIEPFFIGGRRKELGGIQVDSGGIQVEE